MLTVSQLLKQCIKRLGYEDIKECARAHDIPYELFRKVISDGHIPKDSTLLTYAEKFNIEPAELIGSAYFHKMPHEVRVLFPSDKDYHPSSLRMAPVVGLANCGEWLESSQQPDWGSEPSDLHDDEAFFVIAEGDSMMSHIPDGALLLVSPKSSIHNGNVVLARRGEDDYTVKSYYRNHDGTVILQPFNANYQPLVVRSDEKLICMRIVEIRIRC